MAAAPETPRSADSPSPALKFEDGLGQRLAAQDPFGEPIEQLRLCTDLAALEPAIRERIGRLINFRHARYVRLRGSERLPGPDKHVVIAYDAVQGARVAQLLDLAHSGGLRLDIDVALAIVRELLPAIAVLHDSRNVTHGAIGPERLVLTPQGRLIIVDHGLGLALGKTGYSRRKFWQQLRVAVPPGSGKVVFDARTDVVQIGLVALALVLGRPIDRDEYPQDLGKLIDAARETSAKGQLRPLAPDLRAWLERSLPTEHKASFATVREAQQAFEALFSGKRTSAGAAALKALVTRYEALGRGETPADAPAAAPKRAPEPVPADVRVAEAALAELRARQSIEVDKVDKKVERKVEAFKAVEPEKNEKNAASERKAGAGKEVEIGVARGPQRDAFAALRDLEAHLADQADRADQADADEATSLAEPIFEPDAPLAEAPDPVVPPSTLVVASRPAVVAQAAAADIPASRIAAADLSQFEQTAADTYQDAASSLDASRPRMPEPPARPSASRKVPPIDAQAILQLTAVDDETPLVPSTPLPSPVSLIPSSAPPTASKPSAAPQDAKKPRESAVSTKPTIEIKPNPAVATKPPVAGKPSGDAKAPADVATKPAAESKPAETKPAVAATQQVMQQATPSTPPRQVVEPATPVAAKPSSEPKPTGDIGAATAVPSKPTAASGLGTEGKPVAETQPIVAAKQTAEPKPSAATATEPRPPEAAAADIASPSSAAPKPPVESKPTAKPPAAPKVVDASPRSAPTPAPPAGSATQSEPATVPTKPPASPAASTAQSEPAVVLTKQSAPPAAASPASTESTASPSATTPSIATPSIATPSVATPVAPKSVAAPPVVPAAAVPPLAAAPSAKTPSTPAPSTIAPSTSALPSALPASRQAPPPPPSSAMPPATAPPVAAPTASAPSAPTLSAATPPVGTPPVAPKSVAVPPAAVSSDETSSPTARSTVAPSPSTPPSASAPSVSATSGAPQPATSAPAPPALVAPVPPPAAAASSSESESVVAPSVPSSPSSAPRVASSQAGLPAEASRNDIDTAGGQSTTSPTPVAVKSAESKPAVIAPAARTPVTPTSVTSTSVTPTVNTPQPTASQLPPVAAWPATVLPTAAPPAAALPTAAPPTAAPPTVAQPSASADAASRVERPAVAPLPAATTPTSLAASAPVVEVSSSERPLVVPPSTVAPLPPVAVAIVASPATSEPAVAASSSVTQPSVTPPALVSSPAVTPAPVVPSPVASSPVTTSSSSPAFAAPPSVASPVVATSSDLTSPAPASTSSSAAPPQLELSNALAAGAADAAPTRADLPSPVALQRDQLAVDIAGDIAGPVASGALVASIASHAPSDAGLEVALTFEAAEAASSAPPAAIASVPPAVVAPAASVSAENLVSRRGIDWNSDEAISEDVATPAWARGVVPSSGDENMPPLEPLRGESISATAEDLVLSSIADVPIASASRRAAWLRFRKPIGSSSRADGSDGGAQSSESLNGGGTAAFDPSSDTGSHRRPVSLLHPGSGFLGAALNDVPDAPVAPRPRPVRRMPRVNINWKRTLAASLVVSLLEGVAFATAYWFATPTEPGSLLVETTPGGIEVLVDGRVSGKTPYSGSLVPGRHTIELRVGASSRVIPVEISPGVQTMQRVLWSKGLRTGQARITSTPAGARVNIDGLAHGVTPLTVSTLAAGRHNVVIVSDSGTVSAPLSISPGETTEMDVPVFPGWVSVLAPVELQIYEGERLLGTTEGEKLLVAPGKHTLTFVSEPLGYRGTQTVLVTPGATAAISMVLPKAPVSVVGPPGAELFIDGEPAGALPIDSVRAVLGTRDFVIRHPQLGERRQAITVTQKAPARVVFD